MRTSSRYRKNAPKQIFIRINRLLYSRERALQGFLLPPYTSQLNDWDSFRIVYTVSLLHSSLSSWLHGSRVALGDKPLPFDVQFLRLLRLLRLARMVLSFYYMLLFFRGQYMFSHLYAMWEIWFTCETLNMWQTFLYIYGILGYICIDLYML